MRFIILALKDVFATGKLEQKKVYVVDDIASAENGTVPLAIKISRTSPEEPITEEKPTFRCNVVTDLHNSFSSCSFGLFVQTRSVSCPSFFSKVWVLLCKLY